MAINQQDRYYFRWRRGTGPRYQQVESDVIVVDGEPYGALVFFPGAI